MSNKKKNNNKGKPAAWKNPIVVGLLNPLPTKGKVGTSAAEMLKSAAFGLVGTGLGMAIGKPSLLVGMGTSLVANYLDFQPLKTASIGMMATGGYQFIKGVNGTQEEGIEGVKERLKEFGANLKENLYLNKLFKPKSKGVNGLDDVQYFKYPQDNQLDMGALDEIEQGIAVSGQQFGELNAGAFEDLQILGAEERIL